MGRNRKQGLDYFPFDVGFFSDVKIRKIARACGASSTSILICLLCNIYKDNGYYILWDEDLPFVIADTVGVSEGAVKEVMLKALQVGFFDQSLYDKYKILTSKGIQSRFKSAVYKREEIEYIADYLVSDVKNEISDVRNPVSDDRSTQSKVKKRKEEKIIKKEISSEHSRGENNKPGQPLPAVEEEFEKFRKAYPGNKGGHKVEFDNFKKKHSDYQAVVYLLSPALSKLREWREQKKQLGQFVPEYANLSTWLNQRRWEVEFEKVESDATKQTEFKKSYDNGDFLR